MSFHSLSDSNRTTLFVQPAPPAPPSIAVQDFFEPINMRENSNTMPELRKPDVCHVDLSGRAQFLAVDTERFIEINKSKMVYHHFVENGLDDIPLRFRNLAKRLLWRYQRAIHLKARKHAVLSLTDERSGMGLPRKQKPEVVRRAADQWTHNLFLVEYVTPPLSPPPKRRSKRLRRKLAREERERNSDSSGHFSSHSVEW